MAAILQYMYFPIPICGDFQVFALLFSTTARLEPNTPDPLTP